MPTEGEAVRPSVITRFECPKHGIEEVGETVCRCGQTLVERVYWAAPCDRCVCCVPEAECERRVAQAREKMERVEQSKRSWEASYNGLAAKLLVTERERDEAREQLARAREGYWPADEVEMLRKALNDLVDLYRHPDSGRLILEEGASDADDALIAADKALRRFSGEGAS